MIVESLYSFLCVLSDLFFPKSVLWYNNVWNITYIAHFKQTELLTSLVKFVLLFKIIINVYKFEFNIYYRI